MEDLHLSNHELLELMTLVRNECSEKMEVFTELPQFIVYSSQGNGESISDDSQKALSIERYTVSSFFDCAGTNNFYRKFAAYLGGCPAGRIYCNIQPNGNVTPCMFMPTYPVAGNLREQTFEEIWNSPTFEALRDRTNIKGKCGECRFVDVCGGCRAKAAAYEGDYCASDPTCPIQAANA
jgi:radical SAM protein with 4Fe4S-binding SPASM domain